MSRQEVVFQLEGSVGAVGYLRHRVEHWEQSADLNVHEVLSGDAGTTLQIIASSIAIIECLVRMLDQWTEEAKREERVRIVLPTGKRIDLDKDHVDEIEEVLRDLIEIDESSDNSADT